MMQQKVRKKNRPVLMLTQEKSETWLFRYIKEANLKGVRSWNKLKSLRSLVMLKCGRRTSLHAVQYKWQSGSVLMSCLYSVRNGQPNTCVLPDASLALFLARSQFFLPNPRRVVELTWWSCDLKIKTSTSCISLRSHLQQHFSRNFEKFLRVQLLLAIPQDVSFCSAISRYGAQLKLHD